MLAEESQDVFHRRVAEHRLKVDGSRRDRPLRIIGALLMAGGVVGAFVAYQASLAQDDVRDIASGQLLALACEALVVVGAALFITASVARVLRLFLLRQLVEGQAHTDQIAATLSSLRYPTETDVAGKSR